MRDLVEDYGQKGRIRQPFPAGERGPDGDAVREVVHRVGKQVEPATGQKLGLHGLEEGLRSSVGSGGDGGGAAAVGMAVCSSSGGCGGGRRVSLLRTIRCRFAVALKTG